MAFTFASSNEAGSPNPSARGLGRRNRQVYEIWFVQENYSICSKTMSITGLRQYRALRGAQYACGVPVLTEDQRQCQYHRRSRWCQYPFGVPVPWKIATVPVRPQFGRASTIIGSIVPVLDKSSRVEKLEETPVPRRPRGPVLPNQVGQFHLRWASSTTLSSASSGFARQNEQEQRNGRSSGEAFEAWLRKRVSNLTGRCVGRLYQSI